MCPLAFPQHEQPDGHVHENPRKAQELYKIVHEQIASLQVSESCNDLQNQVRGRYEGQAALDGPLAKSRATYDLWAFCSSQWFCLSVLLPRS